MKERTRVRLSPLAVAMPLGVCMMIGAFTYAVAVRAGYPPVLAGLLAGTIGLLWLAFFIGRLIGQARP